MSVLHVRHALENTSVPSSAKQQQEICSFDDNVRLQQQIVNSLCFNFNGGSCTQVEPYSAKMCRIYTTRGVDHKMVHNCVNVYFKTMHTLAQPLSLLKLPTLIKPLLTRDNSLCTLRKKAIQFPYMKLNFLIIQIRSSARQGRKGSVIYGLIWRTSFLSLFACYRADRKILSVLAKLFSVLGNKFYFFLFSYFFSFNVRHESMARL